MHRGRLRQHWTVITCTFSVCTAGCMFAWFTPLMLTMAGPDSPIPMTKDDLSWISASIALVAAVATIPAGISADFFGRKKVILFCGPLNLAGCLLIFSRSIGGVHMFRVISGIATGIVHTVVPAYITEISDPEIRGQLVGYFQIMWYVGVLFAYISGSYLTFNTHVMSGCMLSLVFFLTFAFAPESPTYYLIIKETDKAVKSFEWLRGCSRDMSELEDTKKAIEEAPENEGWLELITKSKNAKTLLIVLSVSAIYYLAGSTALVVYATHTFALDPNAIYSENTLTVCVGLIFIASSCLSSWIIDRSGRRPLLILSCLGTSISSFCIGLYFFLEQVSDMSLEKWVWGMYASVTAYCFFVTVGLASVLHIARSEYFGSQIRTKAGAITATFGIGVKFLVLKLYQNLQDWVGVFMNFWMYSIFTFGGAVLFWSVLPETKGMSLAEIERGRQRRRAAHFNVELQETSEF